MNFYHRYFLLFSFEISICFFFAFPISLLQCPIFLISLRIFSFTVLSVLIVASLKSLFVVPFVYLVRKVAEFLANCSPSALLPPSLPPRKKKKHKNTKKHCKKQVIFSRKKLKNKSLVPDINSCPKSVLLLSLQSPHIGFST